MDDVFRRINVCASTIGEEYLYKSLHELTLDDVELEKREAFMDHLYRNPKLRLELQDLLAGIGKRKYNNLCYYLFHAAERQIVRPWVFIILMLIPVLAAISLLFSLQPGIIILIISILTNLFVHQYYLRQFESELDTLSYFGALVLGATKLAGCKEMVYKNN